MVSNPRNPLDLVDGSAAFQHLHVFADHWPHVTGSRNERIVVEYVADRFRQYGAEVREEEFPVKTFELSKCELHLSRGEPAEAVECFTPLFSTPTPHEGLEGQLVHVEPESAWEDGPLPSGRFLAMGEVPEEWHDGRSSYRRFAHRAQRAGAAGVVLYTPDRMLVGNPPRDGLAIPMVYVRRDDGLRLRARCKSGPQVGRLFVHAGTRRSTGTNVIGRVPGRSSAKRLIFAAHHDSVSNQGISDDAAAVAVLLEVARCLHEAGARPPHDVELISFSAEETSCRGSQAYAKDHREALDEVLMMLAIDPCPTGDALILSAFPDFAYAEAIRRATEASGLRWRSSGRRAGGDAWPFERAGVPACLIYPWPTKGPRPRSNSADDDLTTIDPETLARMTQMLLHLTESAGTGATR